MNLEAWYMPDNLIQAHGLIRRVLIMCRLTTTGRLLPTPAARTTRGSSVCGMATCTTTIRLATSTCGQYVPDSLGYWVIRLFPFPEPARLPAMIVQGM